MTKEDYWLIYHTAWIRMFLLKLRQGDHLPEFLQLHNRILQHVDSNLVLTLTLLTGGQLWWCWGSVGAGVCMNCLPRCRGRPLRWYKHSGMEINLSTYNRNSGEWKRGEGNQTEYPSGVCKKNIGISYLFTDTANSTLNKNFVRIIPTTGISQWSLNGRK